MGGDNEVEEPSELIMKLLEERLPLVGLDSETYGPYILGLLQDDVNTEVNEDEDAWDNILELLKASSESHSDDEDVWIELKKDIQKSWGAFQSEYQQRQKQLKQQQLDASTAKLKQEAEVKQEKRAKDTVKSSSAVDEATKRDLMARYAYEEDEEAEPGAADSKGPGGAGSEPPTPSNPNKEFAKQASLEKAKELRSQNTYTKKEEQQKTKAAKLNKIQLKEERRKKTIKGERKR